MKIIEGFRLRCVGGQHFVLGEGLAQLHDHRIITLNEAAAYLWKSVEDKEFNADDLTQLLITRYTEHGITEALAQKEAESTIRKWTELELIA